MSLMTEIYIFIGVLAFILLAMVYGLAKYIDELINGEIYEKQKTKKKNRNDFS